MSGEQWDRAVRAVGENRWDDAVRAVGETHWDRATREALAANAARDERVAAREAAEAAERERLAAPVTWLTGVLDDAAVVAADGWQGPIEQRRSDAARIEAERAIIREHEPYDDFSSDCSSCGDVPQTPFPCDTLRWLAYGHRFDAPGWLPEWAPEGAS